MKNPEELKRIYLSTTLSQHEVEQSWEELSLRLPSQKGPLFPTYYRYPAFAVAVFLILISVLFTTSIAAKPDSPLFTIKVLSQQALHTLTGEKAPKTNPATIHSTIKSAKNTPTIAPSPSITTTAKSKPTSTVTPRIQPNSQKQSPSSQDNGSDTRQSPTNTPSNPGQEVKSEKTENLPSRENPSSEKSQGQSDSHTNNGKNK